MKKDQETERLTSHKSEALAKFDELGMLLKTMEVDFAKAMNSNKLASKRVRKGLKLLSNGSLSLRKSLLGVQKTLDEGRK